MTGPSTATVPGRSPRRSDAGGGTESARRWAVWLWAGLGVFFLLLQAWIWLSFLSSGPEQLTRYRDRSSAAWTWARIFELVQVGWLVVTVVAVGREVARERRMTRNARVRRHETRHARPRLGAERRRDERGRGDRRGRERRRRCRRRTRHDGADVW